MALGRRPTIQDLAREAGVSVATIDRVLNGRGPVREETAQKVFSAAQRINYHGANAIRDRVLSNLPEYHLGFVLRRERHAFYQDFARRIEDAARADPRRRLRVTIRFLESQTPEETAEMLLSFAGKVHALAASVIDHPQVTQAVAALRSRGIPTFALLSDFAQGVRETYLGTNNLKVGRSVGWLMTHLTPTPGPIAIIMGGHRWHGHELRETGFRSYMREYAPQFQVLDTIINLETREFTRESLRDLLDRHPGLVGVYVAGGGMEGAIAALREARAPGAVSLIVNEITPETRQGLLDNYISMVMVTPLRELCEELMGLMTHSVAEGMAETPGQRFFTPNYLTPESL